MCLKICSNLLNLTILNFAVPYTTCFSSARKTCAYKINAYKNEIATESNLDETSCKARCTGENNCKFVFHSTGGDCITYFSCSQTRNSLKVGKTFAVYGNCPGTFFLL